MIKLVSSSAEFVMDNQDNVILFTGRNDKLTFLNGGGDSTIAMGTNQSVALDGCCAPEVIYDFARGLTIDLGEFVNIGQTKVYGMQRDPTAHVHLLYGGHAALAPDGHGGTLLTASGGFGPQGTVDFVYDPHVHVT